MTSAPVEKEKSINAVAAAAAGSKIDHLSAPPSAIPSGTATPAEKKDEENTTAEKEKAKVDHLSAPPSAIPSGTATPAEKEEVKKELTSAPADKAVEDLKAETPAGSTVEDAKNVDKRVSIAEEIIKEISPKRTYEDLASVISGVESMQVGDGAKVGEQEAKKAEEAVKSVED